MDWMVMLWNTSLQSVSSAPSVTMQEGNIAATGRPTYSQWTPESYSLSVRMSESKGENARMDAKYKGIAVSKKCFRGRY